MLRKNVYLGAVIVCAALLSAHFIMPISEDIADKSLVKLNAAADGPGGAGEKTYSAEKPAQTPAAGILGKFTTKFSAYPKNRNVNIRLAAESIDGIIVMPGQVFSFNDAVGPTTKANGFRLARTFLKGRDTRGYGGGVCQVSSTLYNAALMAGMEIVERHAHSRPVTYVEEGRDASTSYGSIDFKFRNVLDYPVRVSSYMGENDVTVWITAA